MLLNRQFAYDEDFEVNDFLAIERTVMANDRTLLSFLRTSLYFCIAGLTISSLVHFKNHWIAEVVFWAIGVITLVVGIVKYYSMKIKIAESRNHIRSLKNHISTS